MNIEDRGAFGRPTIEVNDLGDSEAILRNKAFLLDTVRQLIRRDVVPQEPGWRHQKALKDASILEQQRSAKEKERRRARDRGR
jgi:hypothetical protein